MRTPFQFQVDMVDRISISLAQHRSTIGQAPPGAGKTFIASMIIQRALSKGKTILVLSETAKIYSQLVAEFNSVEIDSNVKSIYVKPNACYTAMAQTLRRRPMIIEQFKRLAGNLIVISDEAHLNTMTPVLKELPEAYRVGFTATPIFKFSKHLPDIYNDLVHGPQVEELIQLGRLCNYKHIARTRGDMSLLEIRNGEYTEKSQDKVFNSTAVYQGLFEDLRSIKFKKCIVFVASIEGAESLNAELLNQGFNSVRFHSNKTLLPHPEFELAKFTQLNLANILVSIRSLSKGWDYPAIDLVVLNHKTTSTSLYLQEVGRGSRIIPGIKEFFTVLDYGDNWKQHGLYFEHRDFTELWNQAPQKLKDAAAPVKHCPACDALLTNSMRVCPYCTYAFPVEVKELEIGELVEITADYAALSGKKVSELSAYDLSVYIKTLNKKPYGARVARAREQSEPGFLEEYCKFMGYKSSWVEFQKRMINPDEKIEYLDLVVR